MSVLAAKSSAGTLSVVSRSQRNQSHLNSKSYWASGVDKIEIVWLCCCEGTTSQTLRIQVLLALCPFRPRQGTRAGVVAGSGLILGIPALLRWEAKGKAI